MIRETPNSEQTAVSPDITSPGRSTPALIRLDRITTICLYSGTPLEVSRGIGVIFGEDIEYRPTHKVYLQYRVTPLEVSRGIGAISDKDI